MPDPDRLTVTRTAHTERGRVHHAYYDARRNEDGSWWAQFTSDVEGTGLLTWGNLPNAIVLDRAKTMIADWLNTNNLK